MERRICASLRSTAIPTRRQQDRGALGRVHWPGRRSVRTSCRCAKVPQVAQARIGPPTVVVAQVACRDDNETRRPLTASATRIAQPVMRSGSHELAFPPQGRRTWRANASRDRIPTATITRLTTRSSPRRSSSHLRESRSIDRPISLSKRNHDRGRVLSSRSRQSSSCRSRGRRPSEGQSNIRNPVVSGSRCRFGI